MNIIKSSVETYMESDPILKLEKITRVCTKTEHLIPKGKGKELIAFCMEKGHTSILKHYMITLHIPDGFDVPWVNAILHANKYLGGEVSDDGKVIAITGNLLAWRDWIFHMAEVIDMYKERIPRDTMDYICHIVNMLQTDYSVFMSGTPNVGSGTVDTYMYFKEATNYLTLKWITNRAVTHQAVRHTVFGFLQESTRYVNYLKKGFSIIAPDAFEWGVDPDSEIYQVWYDAMKYAEAAYDKMLELGCKPEEAKLVLPHSIKADIYITGTFSQWEGLFKLRNGEGADPQIKQLMPESILAAKAQYELWKNLK